MEQLLLRELFMKPAATGGEEPMPELVAMKALPNPQLCLVNATNVRTAATATLDRLDTLPGNGDRDRLLEAAAGALQRHHHVALPAHNTIDEIADEIVELSQDYLAYGRLKSCLEDLFKMTTSIEHIRQDLQSSTNDTNKQRRLESNKKRYEKRVQEQVTVYHHILPLVTDASTQATTQLPPVPNSDEVHRVMVILQQVFEFPGRHAISIGAHHCCGEPAVLSSS